jgi:carboxymethylenebutenolidase
METNELEDVVLDAGVDGASVGLKGVIGIPAGDGPWPGVVVVHEAFGVDAEMRKQISHLAALGYIALMPDLFTEGGFRRCIGATFRSMTSGEGRAYADIETARRTLLARPDCTGAIGVIGFCMGGGFAIMTAARGFDAASVNYGMMPKDLEATLEGACPIVASYGAKDSTLKGAAAKLELTLTDKSIPHDVKEYPGAGHAFLNEKMTGPALMAPFARVMNFGPKPEAAVDAWKRIEAFFAEHLSGPSPR